MGIVSFGVRKEASQILLDAACARCTGIFVRGSCARLEEQALSGDEGALVGEGEAELGASRGRDGEHVGGGRSDDAAESGNGENRAETG